MKKPCFSVDRTMWEDRGKTLEEEIGKREKERGKWSEGRKKHHKHCAIIIAQLVHNSVYIASSWDIESD